MTDHKTTHTRVDQLAVLEVLDDVHKEILRSIELIEKKVEVGSTLYDAIKYRNNEQRHLIEYLGTAMRLDINPSYLIRYLKGM